ncbi:MAG: hypothetical protein ACR2N5_08360 [Solirubrobacterales bacterium]
MARVVIARVENLVISGLDPENFLGALRLGVSDAAAQREFYERVIGLGVVDGGPELIVLGAGERRVLEL